MLAAADCLPQVVNSDEKPSLQEEFVNYCTALLPIFVKAQRDVDKYWHAVGQVQNMYGHENRYPILTRLAKSILIIPHGNTYTKRLFSHVGLNKTKHRNCLGLFTLNALLSVQFNEHQPWFNFKPSNDLLKRCKNALAEVQEAKSSH